jgi:hypothetical protein
MSQRGYKTRFMTSRGPGRKPGWCLLIHAEVSLSRYLLSRSFDDVASTIQQSMPYAAFDTSCGFISGATSTARASSAASVSWTSAASGGSFPAAQWRRKLNQKAIFESS